MLLAAVSFAAATAPARAPAVTHSQAVPILLYHAIGPTPASAPYPALYVGAAAFRTQMGWLAQHGWHPVTMDALLRSWRGGRSLPRKPVVLSFDDGYPGDWRYAMPILRRHGFVGVLNLQIGNLVPRHVRQLIAAGWEIDSHTFTHPDLRTVTDEQLDREVVHSRRWLQSVFHVPVPAFCYPFGRYDARVVAAVERAGYLLAETENQGWASPGEGLLTLDRLRVTPETGVEGVASLLRG